MVFYYSRGGKTKVFADALGEYLGCGVTRLETELDGAGKIGFLFKAMRSAFSGKGALVTNMPDAVPEEIFLCSPIWAGELATPAKYFLENADLKNTTVHLLLTASVPVEKYKTEAQELLYKIACKPGRAYIFATSSKAMPDRETITEHFRELL